MPNDWSGPDWSKPVEHPLTGLSQRMPPANLMAEQALLGAIFFNNKAYDRVASFLRPEHFADPINGRIYRETERMIRDGRLVDALTLKGVFENSGVLDEVGGTAYFGRLLASMVGIINASEYGRTIHDAWLRRQLIDIGEGVVNNAFGADMELDGNAQVADLTERVLKLGEQSELRAAVDYRDALGDAVAQAEAAYRGLPGHARIDTGIAPVDALWRGMWPGDLYYLMARSRTGKTPAMMQFARNVAGKLLADTPEGETPPCVHVFSLEMPAAGIANLGIAANSRWDVDTMRNGEIGGPDAWMELGRIRDDLARLPIIIDDQAEMDINALVVRARATARRRKTRLICIDFRELVRRPREHAKMALPEWIPYLGYQLKALAKALQVPVLALAQINKSRDTAESSRPTLNDLPYDGGQAADGVFALHRPELTMGDEPPRSSTPLAAEKQASQDEAWRRQREAVRGVAEFIALKRRGGATGLCRLRFDGPRQLLHEIKLSNDTPDLLDAPPPMSEHEYGAGGA